MDGCTIWIKICVKNQKIVLIIFSVRPNFDVNIKTGNILYVIQTVYDF